MALIPKSYYHNKTILALIAVNLAMLTLVLILTLTGVDRQNPEATVSYRETLLEVVKRGPTSQMYGFALYSLIVTVVSFALSIRLFPHRHRLAMSVLGLNLLLLLFTLVVFNALSGVQ